VTFSSDFELDPPRMDLLNLSDVVFRKFAHTPDMDSRCANALQGSTFVRAE
jgi:hypothetical protein